MAAVQVEVLLNGLRDTSGSALSGGKVYTYTAGTLTSKTTWTDIDKSTPAANPVVLDANGRAQIYADGNYKFVVDDSSDNTLYTWDDLTYGTTSPLTTGLASGGSSGAYTLTPSPAASSYSNGDVYLFTANHTSDNIGGSTLNISSLGAKNITTRNSSGTSLADPLIDDCTYLVQYNSTDDEFNIINGNNSGIQVYTATLDSVSGIIATGSASNYYSVDGGWCTVTFLINFDISSATSASVGMSLPFHADEIMDNGYGVPIMVDDSTTAGYVAGRLFFDTSDTKVNISRESGDWQIGTGHRATGQFLFKIEE